MKVSAGCLMYRESESGELEFFLVHPGGPYWKGKDLGSWTIPKGLVEGNELTQTTAVREFEEETNIKVKPPLLYLDTIKQKGGKLVHCYAFETKIKGKPIVKGNMCDMEYRGETISIPEIDDGGFFTYTEAKKKINVAQIPFIERLTNYYEEN
jgi:predicted NUDIX family NTP pyrophosphohydrolase